LKAKFTFLPFLGLSLLLVLPLAARGASDMLIQRQDVGCIDWSTGTVRGRGIAAPTAGDEGGSSDQPAQRLDAARRMAQSNLLETVNAIRINAVSRVADRVARSPDFRNGLLVLVQNAVITRQEYLSDGTVEIELTMNLTGGFGQFVLPDEIRQVDSVVTVNAAPPDSKAPPMPADGADSDQYTGLIIDATGIGAAPSLVPEIVDESGVVVYGPAFVSREFAVSRGMCGFSTTVAAARGDKRVGDRPLVVRALGTRSTGKTDLVISKADAAQLRSSVVHLNFLKACRVSIVMDLKTDP
jgi:hypothetical protein